MKKGKIFEAYNNALMTQIWRGESILFHHWGILWGKEQKLEPVIEMVDDGQGNKIPQQKMEDDKPKFDVSFEKKELYY